METRILHIDAPAALQAVEELLARAGIFVAPTDTVYGLFCRYDSPAALARIYAAKDRPPQKAIPILIGAAEQLAGLVQPPIHPAAQTLMARFWPGPLTLVLPAQRHLPPELTAGAPTVAVRMPNHDALRRLLGALGPLAATSANRSGHAETHSVPAVLAQLEGRVELILHDETVQNEVLRHETVQNEVVQDSYAPARADAQSGSKPESDSVPALASTIVDLSAPDNPPRILREGPLGEAVRELLSSIHGAAAHIPAPTHAHRG